MKYLHYWRFNRQWYMKINDTAESCMITGKNEDDIYSYILQEDYLIQSSIDMTNRQIKDRLIAEHPDCVLIKEIAYHEGARWRGNKAGSRERNPYKKIYNRARSREKAPIKIINKD